MSICILSQTHIVLRDSLSVKGKIKWWQEIALNTKKITKECNLCCFNVVRFSFYLFFFTSISEEFGPMHVFSSTYLCCYIFCLTLLTFICKFFTLFPFSFLSFYLIYGNSACAHITDTISLPNFMVMIFKKFWINISLMLISSISFHYFVPMELLFVFSMC